MGNEEYIKEEERFKIILRVFWFCFVFLLKIGKRLPKRLHEIDESISKFKLFPN